MALLDVLAAGADGDRAIHEVDDLDLPGGLVVDVLDGAEGVEDGAHFGVPFFVPDDLSVCSIPF